MKGIIDRCEGDINISPEREKWIKWLSPETRNLLERDSKHFIHQSLSTPCLNAVNKSYGCYLEDLDGNRILDFHGNNVHQAGFGNEYIVEAVIAEMKKLPFCSRRYTNETAVELAEKLSSLTAGELSRVLYSPAATISISMAIKLARLATGKNTIISLWDSFHGATVDSISLGGEHNFRNEIGSLMPGIEHVFPYNSYRPLFGNGTDHDLQCAEYVEYVIKKDNNTAAVVLETIRNTDVMIPTIRYMKRIRELCTRHGVLMILDETAVCLGRTGRMFAYENFGIVPDMVILGKGLGGGVFPFSCLIARDELNKAWFTSLGHFTHEKSPAGSRAALSVIEFIEKENMLSRVLELESRVRTELLCLKDKYRIIGDVRIKGLLFCIELVRDRKTMEKAEDEAERVMYGCLKRGLNFKVSAGNVLTFSPPLVVTDEELLHAFTIIEESLKEIIVL